MTQPSLSEAFAAFNNCRIIIIGDVMMDTYLWGKVNRISPEAPVPIVTIKKRESRLGGAGNVAINLVALGATPILCSVIGNDEKGKELLQLIEKRGLSTEGIVTSNNRKTTVKTRVIGGSQHILRVDDEIETAITFDESTVLIEKIKKIAKQKKSTVLIFEDYDKGVLTPQLIEVITNFANLNGITTIVDPKKRNFLNYKNVNLFKPNLKELKEGLKNEFENTPQEIEKAIDELKEILNFDAAIITLSEMGVFVKSNDISKIIPAHIRNISDVSGAGDTVISVVAVALGVGLPLEIAAALANLAGGLVCEKVGVVPINKKQLYREAKLKK